MKPKPLEELKNFTVPMAMMGSFTNDRPDGRQEGENIKSGSVWARRARGGSRLALLLEQSHRAYAPLTGIMQGSRDGICVGVAQGNDCLINNTANNATCFQKVSGNSVFQHPPVGL